MMDDIGIFFEQAGCEAALCVQSLDEDAEFAMRADERVVPASVFKVQVALGAETWFAGGRLDPREHVWLRAADRTPGPTGVSLFDDDAEVSWRDMVVLMLTISDNHATDALLRRVGVDALNATAARLGLSSTVVESDLRTMLDSIGQDMAAPAGTTRPPGRPRRHRTNWLSPPSGCWPPARWTRTKGPAPPRATWSPCCG